MSEPIVADTEYEETTIKAVTPGQRGWEIQREDGWSFYVRREHGVEPKIGDVARFYGHGIGYPVRGLTLNGVVVFYRTADEDKARFEQEQADRDAQRMVDFEKIRDDHDRRIAALPEVFRRRIKKFQDTRADFRWQHEAYELFTCEQAVIIAAALKTPAAVLAFRDLSSDEQKIAVPDLSDDHSGNTFGMAVRLAHSSLADPELVYHDHGAMVMLVGCDAYGCPHPVDDVRRAAARRVDGPRRLLASRGAGRPRRAVRPVRRDLAGAPTMIRLAINFVSLLLLLAALLYLPWWLGMLAGGG